MENFEIKRLFDNFISKKWYIISILLLALVAGYFYSYYYVTPMYKSSTTMLLVKADTTSETNAGSETITQNDIALNQKLVSTYAQIIKSNKVLEKVIDNLSLNISKGTLSNYISVNSVNNTEIIRVSVSNSKPDLAAKIANELAKVFSIEVKELYNIDNVNVIDHAEAISIPYNINHVKDLAMFIIMGIICSCGLVVLFYLFNKTIKIEEDVEQYIGLNVLTTVPLYTKTKESKNNKESSGKLNELVTFEDSKSPIAECFRTLRTNLLFTQTDAPIKTVLITSGYMKEGKSWTSANMSIAFAKSNKKVLLIDTDMRKGRQHHIFNLQNNFGLSNALSLSEDNSKLSIDNIEKYIKETQIPNVHIITSGNRPPNPSELIGSKKMYDLLELVKDMYDIIILDGSPSMVVSDSMILSKLVDTTVIVTASRETKIETLQKLHKNLESINVKIAGVVINKSEISMKSYQNKYYYSDAGVNIVYDEEKEEQKAYSVKDLIALYKDKESDLLLSDLYSEVDSSQNNNSSDNGSSSQDISNNTIKSMNINLKPVNKKIELLGNEIKTIKQGLKENLEVNRNLVKVLEEKEPITNIINENTNVEDIKNLDEKISQLKVLIENNKASVDMTFIEEKLNILENKLISNIQEVKDKELIRVTPIDITPLEDKIDTLENSIKNTIEETGPVDIAHLESKMNSIENLINNLPKDIPHKELMQEHEENIKDILDRYNNSINETIENRLKEQTKTDNILNLESQIDEMKELISNINDKTEFENKIGVEEIENIGQEINNLQTIISSAIVNKEDISYEEIQNIIEDSMNEYKHELNYKLNNVLIRIEQDHKAQDLKLELNNMRKDISDMKQILKRLSSDEEDGKVVDINDLKTTKEDYTYNIKREINSAELARATGHVCQILNPSAQDVAN